MKKSVRRWSEDARHYFSKVNDLLSSIQILIAFMRLMVWHKVQMR